MITKEINHLKWRRIPISISHISKQIGKESLPQTVWIGSQRYSCHHVIATVLCKCMLRFRWDCSLVSFVENNVLAVNLDLVLETTLSFIVKA